MSRSDTQSLAHLGKSNRLMLRVLVRHGAPAPAPGRKGDAVGAGSSGYWIPVRWDADSCWLIQPRSGPRPAGRGRRRTARRRGGDQSGGPPGAKRSPGCTGKPGDRPARPFGVATRTTSGQTGPTAGRGAYRDAPTSSVATCAASTESRSAHRGDRQQAGRILEAEVGDPAVAVAGDGAADLRAPGAGPVPGSESPPGAAGSLAEFEVGCLPGVLEATAPGTAPYTNMRLWWVVWQV